MNSRKTGKYPAFEIHGGEPAQEEAQRMKTQTIDQMLDAGASAEEARNAMELFNFLHPGLKIKKNGRIDTAGGDKLPLGLYRSIALYFPEKEETKI